MGSQKSKVEENNSEKTVRKLYEDEFVALDDENLEIKGYYMPTGSSKVIPISQISSYVSFLIQI